MNKSSILIGLEKFRATGFPLWAAWGGTPLTYQKMTNILPSESPLPNFYILPIKALLPLKQKINKM